MALWTLAPVPPLIRSSAWSSTPAVSKASRFSFTALTLPGRVTTSVLPMVPATGRESDARGVCFREEDRIRWIKPGAWRSMSGDTA